MLLLQVSVQLLDVCKAEEAGRQGACETEQDGAKGPRFWRRLGSEGHCMLKVPSDLCTHSDFADLGWGGTGEQKMAPGVDARKLQGLSEPMERGKTIAKRELRALQLTMKSPLVPR